MGASAEEIEECVKNQDWTDIAAKTQTKLRNSMPSEWRIPQDKLPRIDQIDVADFPRTSGLLNETEIKITESYATEIVGAVAAGEWTAEEVTRSFCHRAAIAHQLTNCLTILMFDEGIAQARKLDEHFARTGKAVGPLHGLPVSLKDNFNVKGKPSSVGFCSWALEPMQDESTIVGVLRSLGAIVYVKTNVPTAMMIAETVNNCYGRTVNPLKRDLTSGGSSGGESALIAMRGSPLGVGTDIGGSLRIPAACTGIFTIRPSYGRFPHFDARTGLAGQESVASVHGPMAQSVADLRLWAESVVGTQPWLQDPKVIELPWRPISLPQKLKFAVLWNNGIITPTPPVQRALKETVVKLVAAGHEVVSWPNTDHAEATALLGKFFVADGGKSIKKILEPVSEPMRPEMKAYEDAQELGVYDLWLLQKQRTALCKRYLDRWNAVDSLDAILSPTTPYATTKHGQFRNVSYTCVYNILDYSAVSFPTGVYVDKERDIYPASFKAQGQDDEITKNEYDAATVHGMPVSLQLVSRRLEEERILAITERVVADLAAE
ncbi:amidase [Teratosphaeria nubilosa]|uniref:amidase n=1 Tax=Teratosphaeria nubilosa TaxID=161662 RepID=A0A6G1KVI8_9PEZI|nr:amidase [Teratosphaeria nubilosa]